MRILLVEDEPDAARMLAKGLREQTYAVDVARSGNEALYQLHLNTYDLMILDVMLPERDGLAVCRELRAAGLAIPVLMLTARDAVSDRIAGLDSGADDYLTRPFDFHELLARVRALLRRGPMLHPVVLAVGDLQIDTRSHRVERAGRQVELTAKEYALLEYLARRAGDFDPFSNLIEVYIQRLRRKLDEREASRMIRTLRGEGYLLAAEGGGDV